MAHACVCAMGGAVLDPGLLHRDQEYPERAKEEETMHIRIITAASAVALTLGTGACRRDTPVERHDVSATTETTHEVDRTVELQRHRDLEFSKMDDRVAALERKYEEKIAAHPRGTSGVPATERLRHDVESDVNDVKTA